MSAAPLTRTALAERLGSDSAAVAPIRIIHLGLGHFFRAHTAWFTAQAPDAAEWGIAAFTGRSAGIAPALTAQDGLFTLTQRGPDGDTVEVVTSLVEATPGSDTARLRQLAAEPDVAIITLTVTESGYRLHADGRPDLHDPALVADLERLREGDGDVQTALGRLLTALDARRRAAPGPIAVVSCDNIPGNGAFLARGTTDAAAIVSSELATWVGDNVSFVSTSVDRITPHITEAPAAVAAAGWIDDAPVVAEPFADWVLSGDFPAGRPTWDAAGARFVDDIHGWENRKLWLLNGAHSILTFAGQLRGLRTVADAIADDECRALVDAFWDEAARCLPRDIESAEYRRQLIARFANPRIEHRLSQIAPESTVKVQFRFAAVAEATVASGREPEGSIRALATWIDWILSGPDAVDARSDDVAAAGASTDPVHRLLGLVSTTLAADPDVVARVRSACTAPSAAQTSPEQPLHPGSS